MKDWDSLLTKIRGTVNTVGLYTLARKQRRRCVNTYKWSRAIRSFLDSSSKFPIFTA